MSTIDQLLSEFIDAWNAGRRPRVREYLARLPDGPQRDALADQLTSWLEVAPTPNYDDPTRQAIRHERPVARLLDTDAGLWPSVVPTLRERAGLSISDLAGQLVERFSLDRTDTDRTAGYLTRLEHGSLDPARVSRRLLDALGSILGVRGLTHTATYGLALRPAPGAAGGALFRATAPASAAAARSAAAPPTPTPAAARASAAAPPTPAPAAVPPTRAPATPPAAPARPTPPPTPPRATPPAAPAVERSAVEPPSAAPARAGTPPTPEPPPAHASPAPAGATPPRASEPDTPPRRGNAPDEAPPLAADLEALARAARTPSPRPLDELDRLFMGGPDA